MKRRLLWFLAGLVAATTSFAESTRYYALEVRGGSRVFSLDSPVRKGRVLLFHRYPDGTYMSLSAAEVEKVTPLEAAPPPAQGELAPGQTLYVGPVLSGPRFEMPPTPDYVVSSTPYDNYDYGSDYGYGGGYWPPLPPGPPPPRVPSRIGPNGYPILAPPGSPGSVPPPIGPNGYPILAPQPPLRIQPAPR